MLEHFNIKYGRLNDYRFPKVNEKGQIHVGNNIISVIEIFIYQGIPYVMLKCSNVQM